VGEPEHGPGHLPRLRVQREEFGIRPIDPASLEAGTLISGFRIERLIAAGSVGAVYEATQVSLGRPVALRLIPAGHFAAAEDIAWFDEQRRRMASLHHANLVPFYAAGEWEGGRFTAMRFVRGLSLARLQAEGLAPPPEALEPLVGALRAAHAAGVGHGALTAADILVEESGRAYLTGLGLLPSATPEDDLRALAAVIAVARAASSSSRRRGRARPAALVGVALGVVAAGAFALTRGGGAEAPGKIAPPPPPAKTQPVGSALTGVSQPQGCAEAPDVNTPPCTFAQTRLDAAELTVQRSGVIRAWVVRGASGELELQVIRGNGENTYMAGFTQPVQVVGREPNSFDAELGVRPGDRIGLRLATGATVGVRPQTPGAVITRWDGGLTAEPSPSTGEAEGVELMLRADIEYGARVTPPDQLLGERAASAPDGRLLTDPPISLPVSQLKVAVVEVNGAVAIDVLSPRRLARLEVPDADPAGHVLEVTANCGPPRPGGFCFRWPNPGVVVPLEHQYFVRRVGRIVPIG
jgi:serine/threonine-protein kinase